MVDSDGSLSFYFFDIDDNLLFLPTNLYLWNAERQIEMPISSGEFAAIQNDLSKRGKWQAWATRREETYRDFRDSPGVSEKDQPFIKDLLTAMAGQKPWQGPAWPLLVHAAEKERPIAIVTARGHEPKTIEAGLDVLVAHKLLSKVPPILGIYTVNNPGVRARLGAADPNMTVPSIKKLAIKDAVKNALAEYGETPPHRFGMSDDDPNNVVLAISAMRDCKAKYPDKRFFVINTNHDEYVKLEIFPMAHPVTAAKSGESLLQDHGDAGGKSATPATGILGGNASIYVSDMDRAIGFYRDSLGLHLRSRIGNEWAEFDAGNGFILGLHPNTVKAGEPGAINVELSATQPLEEVVALLKGRGVKFKGPIDKFDNVHLAWLFDLDGNELALARQISHTK
ncbi:catechol 2,3-dioxygenase-like lactoylglutathione lyase family enzyme [Bradyrhizobium japonicum]|uniref:VOC family protein n=1 Tax=Bradyrhizobium japonicum TaxID=375 RepID=UPI0004B5AA29|nr:VOC family protein [Bradyrhizobium japonicum]